MNFSAGSMSQIEPEYFEAISMIAPAKEFDFIIYFVFIIIFN